MFTASGEARFGVGVTLCHLSGNVPVLYMSPLVLAPRGSALPRCSH